MISVCMATYNGGQYLKAQIDSILNQLSVNDELVISDDHSTDNTCAIIKQYNDSRVKLVLNELTKGVTHNFENALLHSNGDIIFLADQDDIWLPTKIKELSQFLLHGDYDVVTGNCALTDSKLNVLQSEYYTTQSPLDKSVCGNFVKICGLVVVWLLSVKYSLQLFLFQRKWRHMIYGLRYTVNYILNAVIIQKFFNFIEDMTIQCLLPEVKVLINFLIK